MLLGVGRREARSEASLWKDEKERKRIWVRMGRDERTRKRKKER